ncbi:F-box only protein 16, partial [Ophiophagus hannah]
MQTKMSTWTPLNHQLMNDKVFEERRNLLGKWVIIFYFNCSANLTGFNIYCKLLGNFDKWTDSQRRRVLTDFLEHCSLSQLKFCFKLLQDRVPIEALDFTTQLPRVLTLYIFSFLDPRSLSRCAQVNWHWNYLTQLDQLWMPKCLRFGWYINFSPTPFEQGIWKKHYIKTVEEFQVTRPKTPPKNDFVVADVQPITKEVPEIKQTLLSVLESASLLRRKINKGKRDLPPWRSSDKHPTDIIRFNYLDNFDPIEQARQAEAQGFEKNPQMSLSAELDSQAEVTVRPHWALHQPNSYPLTKSTAKLFAQNAQWNAEIRPAPARGPIPKLSEKGKKAFTRTNRSSPSQ